MNKIGGINIPEYLAPGVYIEEVEMGARPIEGVSTSTAGFLGVTERGPSAPKLITSFRDFMNKYGGFVKDFYLAYAVDGFFRNGGQRCYISRVVSKDAGISETTLGGKEGEPPVVMKITAVGPGGWGNNVAIIVEDATLSKENNLFRLRVKYWKEMNEFEGEPPKDRPVTDLLIVNDQKKNPDIEEVYDNLTSDEKSPDFYEKRINGISNLIEIEKKGEGNPDKVTTLLKPKSKSILFGTKKEIPKEILEFNAETLIEVLKVNAVGSGAWGNNVALIIEGDAEKKEFKLTVKYWKELEKAPTENPTDEQIVNAQTKDPDIEEEYDNLT